jgi:hypothetical protein
VIVEVSGTGFHNMGAELMLVAAQRELMSWGDVQDVAIDLRTGARAQRERVGCAGVIRFRRDGWGWKGRLAVLAASVTPAAVLRVVHAYKPSSIDVLLDASGFAFGDQWGPLPSHHKAELFRTFSEAGKPVVLLPQAFGPFEDPAVAETARSALDQADVIHARDPESLAHLHRLGLKKPALELAPDFTNLIEPPVERIDARSVIVIPNGRITEMVHSVTASTYLEFLEACCATALEHGFRVIVMAHEAMDRDFAGQLRERFGEDVTIHIAHDPVRSKALVGGAARAGATSTLTSSPTTAARTRSGRWETLDRPGNAWWPGSMDRPWSRVARHCGPQPGR